MHLKSAVLANEIGSELQCKYEIQKNMGKLASVFSFAAAAACLLCTAAAAWPTQKGKGEERKEL